ncbi:MAG: sigma-70 family RNA polymerase sigma factor [Candidatus Margulisiibacteriota bacterium]|jgi:RNA polymerase sigma factor for flagellar operon FliA
MATSKGKHLDISALQSKEQLKKVEKKADISDAFVEEYMPMVKLVVGTIVGAGKLPPGMTYNDLVSYGVEGLIKAWHNFDEKRGVLFKTYASYRVKGEIIDRLRKEWRYRNPAGYKKLQAKMEDNISQFASDVAASPEDSVAKQPGDPVQNVVAQSAIVYLLSLDSMEVSSEAAGFKDSAEHLVEDMEFARERAILWEEVKSMDPDEKKIVHLFYIENKKQNDIADILGLSKSKVSRMHVKLVQKLRRRLHRRLNG